MLIKFNPVRSDAPQSAISVDGDVVTIDGTAYDLSPLGEGDTVQAFAGVATRKNGQIEIIVTLTHGKDAPETTRFPSAVVVESGVVPMPAYDEVQADD